MGDAGFVVLFGKYYLFTGVMLSVMGLFFFFIGKLKIFYWSNLENLRIVTSLVFINVVTSVGKYTGTYRIRRYKLKHSSTF